MAGFCFSKKEAFRKHKHETNQQMTSEDLQIAFQVVQIIFGRFFVGIKYFVIRICVFFLLFLRGLCTGATFEPSKFGGSIEEFVAGIVVSYTEKTPRVLQKLPAVEPMKIDCVTSPQNIPQLMLKTAAISEL